MLVLSACDTAGQSPVVTTPTPTRAAYPVAGIALPTPAVATATASPALLVMQAVAQELCYTPQANAPFKVVPSGRNAQVSCMLAAGHATGADLQAFDQLAESQSAFRAAAAGREVKDLHGFPFAQWSDAAVGFPGTNRRGVWQFGRWLIAVTSFDDTPYQSAIAPERFMETVFRIAVQQHLSPP